MGPLDVLGSLQTQAKQAIRRRLEFLALHEFSVTSGTLLLLSGRHDALPSIKWEQEYSPRFPPFRGGGGGGRGEDRKENYSEAWPRLNSLQFRAAQGRAPPLHSYSAGTLPALALPLAVAERAHPLPASSGPALGEEPEGGAEARGAAQPVSVASPAAAARGRTDGPGPGAAGAGLGRAGEFLSGAASLLRSAA